MSRRIEAIYENGVFRPVEPVAGFRESQRVALDVSDEPSTVAEERKRYPFRDLSWLPVLTEQEGAEWERSVNEARAQSEAEVDEPPQW